MQYFLRPDAQGLISTDLYLIFMSWITGLVSKMGPTDRKLCLQSMCVRSNSSISFIRNWRVGTVEAVT